MSLIKVKSRGTDNVSGRRNLIINGAMQVAQRGTSFTSVSASAYHLDRWQYYVANHDELRTTVSQDSSVPTGADSGFSKSLKIDCTTAESAIAANENLRVWQKIEAQDLVRLGYGTSGAKSTTLSFYVKSSLTGTYTLSFWTADTDRSISKTYTINSANTWEKKTVTIPGDTGGTGINVDNGEGMRVNWFLNAGSNFTSINTNNQWATFAAGRHSFGHTAAWGTNTSHDFFLTGVQFEVGDSASDFEHRSFGEELQLCQRYFQKVLNSNRIDVMRKSGTSAAHYLSYFQEMRASPTLALTRNSTVYGSVNTGAGTSGLDPANNTAQGFSLYIYTNSIDAQVGAVCTVTAAAEL